MNYKIFLIVPIVFSLLLTGCGIEEKNLDILQLDQQAKDIRTHLYAISGDNDYYDNEDIDFSHLKKIKNVVVERSNQIILSHRDDKIDMDVMNDGIGKSITLLYFVWMEEFDAAQSNNDLDNLNYIKDEIARYTGENEVINWIKNNGKKDSFEEVNMYLDAMPKLISEGLEIDANNEKLNDLKMEAEGFEKENNILEYNRVADEYNVLLDENNQKIEEYNKNLEKMKYENIFATFMKMIDASYIFPGQESIPLEK